MRIGVMGDTHGDMNSIRQAVAAVGTVEMWLHTGDFSRDALYVAQLTGLPVTSVAGNCDGRADAKPDEFIEAEGYHIWVTHGHRHGVKQGLGDILAWAHRYEADIVVFGHTHQSCSAMESGILLFNPGSTSEPRRGKRRTCGLITLLPGRGGISPELVADLSRGK